MSCRLISISSNTVTGVFEMYLVSLEAFSEKYMSIELHEDDLRIDVRLREIPKCSVHLYKDI